MKDRFLKRFWQMMFLVMVGMAALAASGCGNHMWMGIGKDLNEAGASIYNHNLEKQNKLEHGVHEEYWTKAVSEFWGN